MADDRYVRNKKRYRPNVSAQGFDRPDCGAGAVAARSCGRMFTTASNRVRILLITSVYVTIQCICKAFELETFPEKKLLVPCALTLNVLKVSPDLGNKP